MQCALSVVAALLGLSLASGTACTGGQLTDYGQCPGAVSDEIHASTLPSLLQVHGARADERSKVAAAMEPNPKPKCDPTQMSSKKAKWHENIPSEVGFWDGIINRFNGTDWERFDRSTPLVGTLRPYLNLPDNPSQSTEIKSLSILVVGSGPSSDIGYSDYEDAKVNLTLTDPLGEMYEGLFEKRNQTPPAHIIPLGGEELECVFAPNVFNLVYSANAIDHSYDAVETLRQMVRVAVPCSWVVVEIFENEASSEGGSGFHKWNFHMEGSRVKLEEYNTTMIYDINDEMRKVGAEMSALLGHQCFLHINNCEGGKKRLRMTIRKLGAGGEKCPLNWIGQDSRVGF